MTGGCRRLRAVVAAAQRTRRHAWRVCRCCEAGKPPAAVSARPLACARADKRSPVLEHHARHRAACDAALPCEDMAVRWLWAMRQCRTAESVDLAARAVHFTDYTASATIAATKQW